MGKKQSIIDKITGLGTGEPNTAAEVRALLTELVNDGFPTPIREKYQTPVYTVPMQPGTDIRYEVQLSLLNNQAIMKGYMINLTETTYYSIPFFKFPPTVEVDGDTIENPFYPAELDNYNPRCIGSDGGYSGEPVLVDFEIRKNVFGDMVFKSASYFPFTRSYFELIYDVKP